MPQTQLGPPHEGRRAGSDDLAGRLKSEQELPHLHELRQAAQQRLRRQRLVERLHALGIRACVEFVDEVIRHHPQIADDLDRRLERYAELLSPSLLRAVGGDRLPPAPLRAVR